MPPVPPRRQPDRGRSLLADHPVQAVTVDGLPACLIALRLPSYRSLPLSCLEDITLHLNGSLVPAHRTTLLLEGHAYRLDELPQLSRIWWFILEVGLLQVRLDAPPGTKSLLVEARMVTVEPYISNGRFHFESSARRELEVIHV